MIGTNVVITGIDEVAEALSYLADKSARRLGRSAAGAMARTYAKEMRRFIKPTIQPDASDKGIGSRTLKAVGSRTFRAKAGIRVGDAKKHAMTVVNRGKKKGVGVSANDLHWFALGTIERHTNTSSKIDGKNRRTGRLDRTKWGGFVQAGVTATELVAVAVAKKTVMAGIDRETARARKGH